MSNTQTKKLEDFAKKVLPGVINWSFYDTDDGSYVLYGKYYIKKIDSYFQVYRKYDDRYFKFNNLKNAATWTILHKHNKFYEAARVLEIDFKLDSLNMDRSIHRKMRNSAREEQRDISSIKLQHDIYSGIKFQTELDKYIILAKTCQTRGFENELTRATGNQKE